jgi:hypothetical protein
LYFIFISSHPNPAVDSGSPLTTFSTALSDTINGALSPPAKYDASTSQFVCSCNATPSFLSVALGNTTFYINPASMSFKFPNGK